MKVSIRSRSDRYGTLRTSLRAQFREAIRLLEAAEGDDGYTVTGDPLIAPRDRVVYTSSTSPAVPGREGVEIGDDSVEVVARSAYHVAVPVEVPCAPCPVWSILPGAARMPGRQRHRGLAQGPKVRTVLAALSAVTR